MLKRRLQVQECDCIESRRQKTEDQKSKKRPAGITKKKASVHKRNKNNLSNLFQNLNVVNEKECKAKEEENPADYKNSFAEHSLNFRKFFTSLHRFLIDSDKSVMKKIANNWTELVEPVMKHLDAKSLTGIKNVASLKQWHYDLTLAEISAKALSEQSTSWEQQMRISREQIESLLEVLAS